ncbi:substrate-binding domain-containing protein [Wenyingzhuangia sp. 2_MG-2023]|uniref:substrate-binding domain-containing protein n=1 Tax=Wenyingzhuangia sp. 2_MG-2023 TaxID=3062639 RepID=UPI0026E3AE31|nr:substrate-binding domain-containing protein [Wenyingzhuangia sp. 2_MG-2023]MDO6737985.1 substrate-binding domain-containing protein [Wenyingzhuangia sp. 2_MG-2023]MDO6802661.1 substrate-binding domain-containing protein [Wenyingzhuangia sp. 1_MG-2023]
MKSIKDIAIIAKVSPGTVDRVLHNRPGVSKKTKERVLKIIEESNYTVNTVASILASKKTYTIATLLPTSKNEFDFWEAPKLGAQKALNEIKNLGFRIESFEFNQFDPDSYCKAFKKMANTNPSAALIAPILNKETQEHIHLLEDKNIPYVFINTETEGLNNLSFIGQKSFQGGFVAGKLFNWVLPENSEVLIVEIRKNVVNYTSINQRLKGFKDFFKNSEKSISVKKIAINTLDNLQILNKELKNYLDQNPNTKGIFVPSSKISFIAKSIIELNRKDIELGGFDNTLENVAFLKNETVDFLISQRPMEQGYDGVKLLFNYLIDKKQPKKNHYLPIEIVLKENVDFL